MSRVYNQENRIRVTYAKERKIIQQKNFVSHQLTKEKKGINVILQFVLLLIRRLLMVINANNKKILIETKSRNLKT